MKITFSWKFQNNDDVEAFTLYNFALPELSVSCVNCIQSFSWNFYNELTYKWNYSPGIFFKFPQKLKIKYSHKKA